MKANLIIENAKVLRKAGETGAKYFVITNGVAKEIDENDEFVEGGESVALTKQNAVAFRFISAPNPTAETKALVENGVFICEGMSVQLGEIKPKRIISNMIGYVVLETDDNKVYFYRSDRDQFKLMGSIPENSEVVYKNAETDTLILAYAQKEEAEKESEDDPVSYNLESGIVMINKKGVGIYPFNEAIIDTNSEVVLVNNNYIFKSREALVGNQFEKCDTLITFNASNRCFSSFLEMDLDCVVTTTYLGALLFKDSNKFVIQGACPSPHLVVETPTIKELDGFDYLVDVTEEGSTTRFAFANSDCSKVKTLNILKTLDRGYIYSVE